MSAVKDKLKRLYLKLVGYDDQTRYWDTRWSLGLDRSLDHSIDKATFDHAFNITTEIMKKLDCQNILEIGCGKAEFRTLPNYTPLDFSQKVLNKYGLKGYVYADVTNRIPLPDKTFDCAMTRYVLMHIPTGKIENAVKEISRVTKKAFITTETCNSTVPLKSHCFNHDLKGLFKKHFSEGKLVTIDERTWTVNVEDLAQ
jgi:ubiquinone/menaquinone biosynthesis C-methylase UbiE